MSDTSPSLDRRHFLGTASASAAPAGSITAAHAAAEPSPAARDDAARRSPTRSHFGDTRPPKWDEMFTLTVGNGRATCVGATSA